MSERSDYNKRPSKNHRKHIQGALITRDRSCIYIYTDCMLNMSHIKGLKRRRFELNRLRRPNFILHILMQVHAIHIIIY